jgi:hypothetical protein
MMVDIQEDPLLVGESLDIKISVSGAWVTPVCGGRRMPVEPPAASSEAPHSRAAANGAVAASAVGPAHYPDAVPPDRGPGSGDDPGIADTFPAHYHLL